MIAVFPLRPQGASEVAGVTAMNDSEMLTTFEFLRHHAGLHDIYEVTTFKGTRPTNGGDGEREVTMEVHDRGFVAGSHRYTVIATDEEGHVAIGDPDVSIKLAMTHIPWHDLDRDDIATLPVARPVPAR
jgi:hypothetical protein